MNPKETLKETPKDTSQDTPTTGEEENTICHVAASHGKLEVLKEFGPDLIKNHFANKNGDTWLHAAFRSSQREIAHYILDTFIEHVEAHTPETSETIIDVAVASAQQADTTSKKRNTLLHTIASTGSTMLIDSLDSITISDFEVQNNFLETVFHTAAKRGHKDAVRKLVSLAEGKKPNKNQLKKILNVQNKDGETVLHLISQFSDLDTIRLLVDKGADLKIQDNCGNTCLHVLFTSSENQLDQLIKVMGNIDSFKDILQMQNDKGETVMHIVCKTCDIECIRSLVSMGASLAIQDKMGNTPLHILVSVIVFQYSELCGQFEKVQEYPQDPLGVSAGKYTAEEVVDKFINLLDSVGGGEKLIPVKNREDETIVHLACRAGHVELARYLIEFGEIKETGNNTNSSLGKANECIDYIRQLDDKTLQVLLKKKDDVSSKKNVMHSIADYGMTELVLKCGRFFQFGRHRHQW